jgi:hypothetical protein
MCNDSKEVFFRDDFGSDEEPIIIAICPIEVEDGISDFLHRIVVND